MEYTMMLAAIIAAVIIMRPYVIRSWNAQVKGWEESTYDSYHDTFVEAPPIGLEGCNCEDTWECVLERPRQCFCGATISASGDYNPPGLTCPMFQQLETRDCTPRGCERDENTARCILNPNPPCCAPEIVDCSPGNPEPVYPQRCFDPERDCNLKADPPCTTYGTSRNFTVCSDGSRTDTGCVFDGRCQFDCDPNYVDCARRQGGFFSERSGQGGCESHPGIGFCAGLDDYRPQSHDVAVTTTNSCQGGEPECTLECEDGFITNTAHNDCICPETTSLPSAAWTAVPVTHTRSCALLRTTMIHRADAVSVYPNLLRIVIPTDYGDPTTIPPTPPTFTLRSEVRWYNNSNCNMVSRAGSDWATHPYCTCNDDCDIFEVNGCNDEAIYYSHRACCEGTTVCAPGYAPTGCTNGIDCGPDVCTGDTCWQQPGTHPPGCRYPVCFGLLPAIEPELAGWTTLVADNSTNPPTFSERPVESDWVYTTDKWCEAPGSLTIDPQCYTRASGCVPCEDDVEREARYLYYDCDGNPGLANAAHCDNPGNILFPADNIARFFAFGYVFYDIPIFLEQERPPLNATPDPDNPDRVPPQLRRIYVITDPACSAPVLGEPHGALSNAPDCGEYVANSCVAHPNQPAYIFNGTLFRNVSDPAYCAW